MTTVCHFASNHEGLDTRIALKECVSLAAAGYDTHLVITASDADVTRAAANGVTVHAMPDAPGRLGRMLRHTWRCYRTARHIGATIYHFHDPELIPYGIWLRACGRCVIYDVHEDYPRDILDKYWLPKWIRKPVSAATGALEHLSAKWFFSIVGATPLITQRFQGVARRAVNVNNYPWPAELAPPATTRQRKAQVCYVGNITRVRGLRPIVEALPLVPDVRFVLCGGFSEPGFEAELRALRGWSQVEYLGKIDRARAREVMAESIAGLVTFLPIRSHLDAQPNKLFEYMSAELPVIGSDFPLWRSIVVASGAGICVDPGSPEAIAGAIRTLYAHPATVTAMGAAGRKAVLTTYNWPTEAAKLTALYRELS
ncbi:MAG TPA: glycosyltransferase family 4 protein [Rhodanobacteraceae bacterium]